MDIPNDPVCIHEFYDKAGVACAYDMSTKVWQVLDGSDARVPEVVLWALACELYPEVVKDRILGQLVAFGVRRKVQWNALLAEAVRQGDIWGTVVALDYADPTIAIPEGNLLHVALASPTIVASLIEAGTNIHAMNKDGKTPLDLADQGGHTESALLLLANGAKRGEHE
mgnify:CR=1 FL=1